MGKNEETHAESLARLNREGKIKSVPQQEIDVASERINAQLEPVIRQLQKNQILSERSLSKRILI